MVKILIWNKHIERNQWEKSHEAFGKSTRVYFKMKQMFLVLFLYSYRYCFFLCGPTGQIGPRLRFIDTPPTHTHTHTDTHRAGRTPLNNWSARRGGRYLHNTKQTQGKNIHGLSGLRTRDPLNQAAIDLRITAQGQRDQPKIIRISRNDKGSAKVWLLDTHHSTLHSYRSSIWFTPSAQRFWTRRHRRINIWQLHFGQNITAKIYIVI